MTRRQAADGISLCLDKVAHALGGAEIVCRHGGDETVAVYLYTVAIEELGKALLIDDLFAKGGGGDGLEVQRRWFGGRAAHKEKFERAHAMLPEEAIAYQEVDVYCDPEKVPSEHRSRPDNGVKMLKACHDIEFRFYKAAGGAPPERHEGYVVERDYNPATGIYTVTMSTPLPYEAGRVFITVPYDIATRQNMLYADWDDTNKRWNRDTAISPTRFVMDDDDIRRSVEVDKDDSELYPDAVLGNISAFRDAASAYEWASGARFAG